MQEPDPQPVARPREPPRQHVDRPALQWIVVERPDQAVLLEEADYVLDSYFDPEYDSWEVLVVMGAEEAEEEHDEEE